MERKHVLQFRGILWVREAAANTIWCDEGRLVLFSVHTDGEQVRTYAIFRPYP